RNVHHIARLERAGGLAPLLVPTVARHADEQLPAALRSMVDVPVVATARLKRHIEYRHLIGAHGREVALAVEVLGVGVVGLADGEDAGGFERGTGVCGHKGLLSRWMLPAYALHFGMYNTYSERIVFIERIL